MLTGRLGKHVDGGPSIPELGTEVHSRSWVQITALVYSPQDLRNCEIDARIEEDNLIWEIPI
jgi:hypothetical protein